MYALQVYSREVAACAEEDGVFAEVNMDLAGPASPNAELLRLSHFNDAKVG